MLKTHDRIFIGLDKTPECDGRTDRQPVAITFETFYELVTILFFEIMYLEHARAYECHIMHTFLPKTATKTMMNACKRKIIE